jgi:hypothetical protein
MNWLETVASIVVGWTALSVVLLVTWSRFMEHLRRKERALAPDATSARVGPIKTQRTSVSRPDDLRRGSHLWLPSQHRLVPAP